MAAHLINFGRHRKKHDDDADDSYIPYNGPYEQPTPPKRRQRQRDSWGDPIDDDHDPIQQDDTVLADRQLYLRYADANTKSVFDDQSRGRTRDQTFSGVSGRTMSSGGAVDPFSARPSTAPPRRSTVSSTNPFSVSGGVGESPVPVPRASRDTRPDANRVSLASIFSFSGLARRPGVPYHGERDASPSRSVQRPKPPAPSLITKTLAKVHSRNNSASDSLRAPLPEEKRTQPQVVHLTQPTTHASSGDTDDDEDYYSSHYAAAHTQRVTPPSDSSHHLHHPPQYNHSHPLRSLSRENSGSTSTSSGHPFAQPFPSAARLRIPDPPQSAPPMPTPQTLLEAFNRAVPTPKLPPPIPPPQPYQFHARPNTPRSANSADGIHTTYGMSCGLVRFTVPAKSLKSPSSTPNLRKAAQFPSGISRQPTAPSSIPAGPRPYSPFIGDDALLAPGTWYDALLNPRPKLKVKRDGSRTRHTGDTPQASPIGQEVEFGPPLGADPASWSQEYNRWRRHNASNVSPKSLLHSQSMGNLNKRQAPPPAPVLMRHDPSKGERPRSFAQDDLSLPTPVPSLNHVLQEGRQLEDQRTAWKHQATMSFGNKHARNLSRTRSKSLTSRGRRKGHTHQTSMEYLAAQACLGNQNINLTPIINPPQFIMPKPGPVEYIASTSTAPNFAPVPPPSRSQPSETLVDPTTSTAPAPRSAPSPTPSNLTESRIGIAISTPPPTSSLEAREGGTETPYSFSHPYAHGGLSFSHNHHKHRRQASQGTSESTASQTSRAAHPQDPLMRQRLPPQLALHPYAASQDGHGDDNDDESGDVGGTGRNYTAPRDSYLDKHPLVGHYRSDSKVPQHSKMWAALSPDGVREVLPGDLQYSPFLSEDEGYPGQRRARGSTPASPRGSADYGLHRSGSSNGRGSMKPINDTAGVAEALVNATSQGRYYPTRRDGTGSSINATTSATPNQPPAPRIELSEYSAPSSSGRPIRPSLANARHNSSSDPSTNHTYGSSPLILEDVPEQDPEENQSLIIHEPPIVIPSPAITSSTSSPSASPRIGTGAGTGLLSESEDLEQFKDLFYRPDRDDSKEDVTVLSGLGEAGRILPKRPLPVTPSPPTTNVSETGLPNLTYELEKVEAPRARWRWSEDHNGDHSEDVQREQDQSSGLLQPTGHGHGALPSPALVSPRSDKSEARVRSRITDGSLQFVFEGMPTPVAASHLQQQQSTHPSFSQARSSRDDGLRGDFGPEGVRNSDMYTSDDESLRRRAEDDRISGSDVDETIHPFKASAALGGGYNYVPEDVQSSRASSLMTGEDKQASTQSWRFDAPGSHLGHH